MAYILFRPKCMNSLYLCDSEVSILASSTKKSWHRNTFCMYYSDVIMSAIASQIIDVSIVCSTVCSGADQRKHQSSVSLAFVRGIHRWPGDSPHERSVTQEMFLRDDAIMLLALCEMIPQAEEPAMQWKSDSWEVVCDKDRLSGYWIAIVKMKRSSDRFIL